MISRNEACASIVLVDVVSIGGFSASGIGVGEGQVVEAKESEATIQELTEKAGILDEELEEIANVADDFGIVLPVSEIVSINIFSEYIHSIYFQPKVPARLLLPE